VRQHREDTARSGSNLPNWKYILGLIWLQNSLDKRGN